MDNTEGGCVGAVVGAILGIAFAVAIIYASSKVINLQKRVGALEIQIQQLQKK